MPKTDAMSVIEAALAPLAGKHVLDIGCGGGVLACSLSDRGARVVGVDPNSEALAIARQNVPTGTFYQAGAEAMPFADRSFDGAIFLNSLHHVPKRAMDRALREAARVTKPAGPIVVIEPLAAGSFFSVLRTVEDETAVRAAAQEAIAEAIEGGAFEQLDRSDYLRREHFADLDEFLARAVAAEPTRAAAVEERRPEVEAAFRRYGRIAADGRMVLDQPIRAHVLAAGA
jgi:ubiquinone/menaquinone biosynthesis C-methylase UbiE